MHYKKCQFYFLIFLLGYSMTLVQAQDTTVVHTIIDANTKKGLAYVNIGVVGKNVGTVSSPDGTFSLFIDDKYNKDTLKFSMIGYESKTYVVADFLAQATTKQSLQINLEPADIELATVDIPSTRMKEKLLGSKTTSKNMQGHFETDVLGNEVGVVIKLKKKKACKIKQFHASITQNTYDTLKFRVNVYTMKNGVPDKNILNQNIITTSNIKSGIMTIDLDKFDIWVEDDFFISLEWIEDYGKNGLYFSAGLFGSTIFSRKTSQGTWRKLPLATAGFSVTILQ